MGKVKYSPYCSYECKNLIMLSEYNQNEYIEFKCKRYRGLLGLDQNNREILKHVKCKIKG